MQSYDVYHLPSYHKIAEERGEGKALFFVYSEGLHTIALPLLIRTIDPSPVLSGREEKYSDATSAYGYIGPVASHLPIPAEITKRFHGSLMKAFLDLNLVTVFSRLHPLMPQLSLLSGLGYSSQIGETVSIDLTIPEEEQWSAFRRNHRADIQHLRSSGVTFLMDTQWDHYDEFASMYRETMQRVHADKFYEFDETYFHGLKRGFGDRLFLCFCKHENKLISGGLVTSCNGIIEFHLAATPNEWLHMAPMKLLFDGVRRWGVSIGARVLHLGGGVGSASDSLFHFKAGFSKTRNQFLTWRLIVQPDINESLVHERLGLVSLEDDVDYTRIFFPRYRLPLTNLSSPEMVGSNQYHLS